MKIINGIENLTSIMLPNQILFTNMLLSLIILIVYLYFKII